jgi:prepilin peptidase CpaA
MFSLEKHWPLIVMSLGLIAGAIVDGWKFKVPNRITFPLIISGWVLGLVYCLPGIDSPYLQDSSNRFGASLAGTVVSFLLLYWMCLVKMMGEGDVKLLMGFGSWMGAYYGLHHGLWLILYSWVCGVLIGGIMGFVMMLPRLTWHLKMTREVVMDIAASKGSISHIAEKAAARKSRMLLLPYGVPLTIGFVGYVWLREFGCLPDFANPFP